MTKEQNDKIPICTWWHGVISYAGHKERCQLWKNSEGKWEKFWAPVGCKQYSYKSITLDKVK